MLTRPKSMLPFQIGLESELVLRGCFFFPVLDFRAAIGILTQRTEIATTVFCFSSCMLRLFGALPKSSGHGSLDPSWSLRVPFFYFGVCESFNFCTSHYILCM